MALSPASPLAALLAAPMRPGRVVWIGVRPRRGVEPIAVQSVELDPANPVPGDHYTNRGERKRQVTLIQGEHLAALGAFLGKSEVPPELVRRNIVAARINLLALQAVQFRLGGAVLEGTGPCHPCSRMEAVLGPGGYNAMRGHGCITARIVSAGTVRLGDTIERVG